MPVAHRQHGVATDAGCQPRSDLKMAGVFEASPYGSEQHFTDLEKSHAGVGRMRGDALPREPQRPIFRRMLPQRNEIGREDAGSRFDPLLQGQVDEGGGADGRRERRPASRAARTGRGEEDDVVDQQSFFGRARDTLTAPRIEGLRHHAIRIPVLTTRSRREPVHPWSISARG